MLILKSLKVRSTGPAKMTFYFIQNIRGEQFVTSDYLVRSGTGQKMRKAKTNCEKSPEHG